MFLKLQVIKIDPFCWSDPETEKAVEASLDRVDVPDERSCLRRGYDWFCGIDNSLIGQTRAKENEIRIEKITSLKQDPRAKKGLLVVLVILVSLDIFLYVFFSTGSKFLLS